MSNFQRFLAAAIISCFFLPWLQFDSSVAQMKEALKSMTEMLGELAEDSGQVASLKEQMEMVEKMDGASGFDLATTSFPEIGSSPILFMVPALALFAAIANKKKGYIIYPILCGFCVFVNATYSGNVQPGMGKVLTYGCLLFAFAIGCIMPKDGTDEESASAEPEEDVSSDSDSMPDGETDDGEAINSSENDGKESG
jgi:hypothetical protein